jgi:D-tyrosyl-tRNA(Tyr) deacylase
VKAVVTRVSSASVAVEATGHHEAITEGLLVLVSIEPKDTVQTTAWMARKVSHLRIFPDDDGRMNRSLLDQDGEVLLISQFTLSGDCTKGHRPSFIRAAPPEFAEPLYLALGEAIHAEYGITVRYGVFGATMRVSSMNEGPITLIVETPS